MVRALITGIKGFAGSHLAEHLLEQGVEVCGVDLEGAPDDNLRTILPSLELLGCDLRDHDKLIDIVTHARPDHIYHLAAQTSVQSSWEDPRATLAANIIGSLHVLEASRAAGGDETKVLMVSSAEVYGDTASRGEALTEERSLQPRTPYAMSKACVEWMCGHLELARTLHLVLVRPFNHIGPRQAPRFALSDFACQIAEMERGKRPHKLKVGDLSVRRDFTDVRDVVKAYRLGLERGKPGEVYNICSGKAVTIREALETLLGTMVVEVSIEEEINRFRPVDVPLLQGDNAKIRRDCGWHPSVPLAQSLHDMLQHWRARVGTKGGSAASPQEDQ